MRAFLICVLAVCAMGAPAAAQTAGARADGAAASAVLRAFYGWFQREGDAAWDQFAQARRFFDPAFFAAIEEGHEQDAFDFGPFDNNQWGTQAYSFGPPVVEGSRVLILVRALRHGNPDLHSRLTAILKKNAAGAYVIDDVIYGAPLQITLRAYIAKALNPCNQGTTYEIRMCWDKQSDAATADLASVYAKVVVSLRKSGIGSAALRGVRAAWTTTRDQTCAFEYELYLPGTIAPQLGVECNVRMTRAFTQGLATLLPALQAKGASPAERPVSPAAQTELDRLFREYLSRLTREQRSKLAAAERAWLAYRDKACAIERGSCLTDLTNERVAELKASWIGEAFGS